MSEQPQLPDHDALANCLLLVGAAVSPAELHGFLSGELAMGAAFDASGWLKAFEEFAEPRSPVASEQAQLLERLREATAWQLEDSQLRFQLLLPADEEPLPQRVAALGEWCQAFLTGFVVRGKAAGKGQGTFSDQVSEAVRDLAAIAQVGVEDAEEGDEAEKEFLEVSLAALTIFLDRVTRPESDPRLH